MKGGLGQISINRLITEYDEARQELSLAEPAMAALEDEQIKKQMKRYKI